MTVVTAAMVIVLSSMNGVSELVENIYKPFDLDITVTPASGKTIDTKADELVAVQDDPAVRLSSYFIEENVLLKCSDRQMVATLKGVDHDYLEMSELDRYIAAGENSLGNASAPTAILGAGIKIDMNVPLGNNALMPLEVMAPIRGKKISKYKRRAFERMELPVSGVFSMNVEYDSKYLLTPLVLAQELLHYDQEASGLELKLQDGQKLEPFAERLQEQLGTDYIVRTRQQKDQLMYQTNKSEKWVTLVIMLFIALIGAFNIIASLTMMMIEKKQDMKMLTSIGATAKTIRSIFFLEGVLISMIGTAIGITIGLLVCWLQQKIGFVELQDSIVDRYPVKVIWTDLLLVFVSVSLIGLVASRIPLRSLSRRYLLSA